MSEGTIEVNGVTLWHRITGEGDPGRADPRSGIRHFNSTRRHPSCQALPRDRLRHARLRGLRPAAAGLRHGGAGGRRRRAARRARDRSGARTSTAPRWAARSRSSSQASTPSGRAAVVINCAAAELGPSGRLIFKNWIDIRAARSGWAGQQAPRRADHLAGARAASSPSRTPWRWPTGSGDPPRLEQRRGLHRGLPGALRHGRPRLPAENHLACARPRRRRGRDDPVGPGPRRRGPAGDRLRDPGRRGARDPRC